MTNSMSHTELIAGLRRDAGDYAKVAQGIPASHELSWSARDVRAWEAADALEAATVEVEVTDDMVEKAAVALYELDEFSVVFSTLVARTALSAALGESAK